jgi:hypothetical protein
MKLYCTCGNVFSTSKIKKMPNEWRCPLCGRSGSTEKPVKARFEESGYPVSAYSGRHDYVMIENSHGGYSRLDGGKIPVHHEGGDE